MERNWNRKYETLPIGTKVRLLRGRWEGQVGTVRSHVNAGFRGMEHGVTGTCGTWGIDDLEVVN